MADPDAHSSPAPDTSAPAPTDCVNMADVRAGVDALDRTLVSLLAQRQGYMEAAARIKPALADVRVPWRIEQVVSNVLAEADRVGLSPRIAEPVWRTLIERCIVHEQATWLALRADGEQSPAAKPEQDQDIAGAA